MTLRDLKESVAACTLHDLTPVNISGFTVDAGMLVADVYDRDAERLAEVKEDLEAEVEAHKATTAELEGMTERASELDRLMLENGKESLAEAWAESERFRATASAQSAELALLRAEISAMRKRKGIEAGVCAHTRDIWTLLCYISQSKENRYSQDAHALCGKINLLR